MPKILTRFAKRLRKDSTDAEKRLWSRIRQRRFFGLKFCRQQPIENYIADFVCFEKRIVIELDGGQHSENMQYDQNRTRAIESNGFLVVRFWNNEVLQNTDGVLEEISNIINPPSAPSLREGGNR